MEKHFRPVHSGFETLRVHERATRRLQFFAGKPGAAFEQMTASGYAIRRRPDFLDAQDRSS